VDLNVIGKNLEWQKVNMEVTDLRSLGSDQPLTEEHNINF